MAKHPSNFQASFGSGEISREMFGRIDDPKYQHALALCRNFITKPQGPVENRPGYRMVREVKDSTKAVRLIEFTFSTTQTVVIEAGDGYFRFHTEGATILAGSPAAYNGGTAYTHGNMCSSGGVNYYCIAATTGNAPPNATYWYPMPADGVYEIPTPYAEADLFEIHYVQSADVLTLVHPSHAPIELRRYSYTDWRIVPVSFTPSVTAPVAPFAESSGHTTAKYIYNYAVTAIDAEGVSESAASAEVIGPTKTISGVTNANPGVFTTSAAHGLLVGQKVNISGATGMTEINFNGYIVNTVPTTTTFTLKKDGVVLNTTSFGTYTASSATLTPVGVTGNIFESGGMVTVFWPAVAGASRYNVYKKQGGLYGYIGQTTDLSMIDDNIAPDMSKTPPVYDNAFSGAGNYPGAVSYYEQRRCFAGTTNKPQNIWMTKSGTESDMSYGLPIKDDDRISFRVAAREANTIRHIVPLSGLILLTSSVEWRVTSVNSDAITPSTISVKPQSYVGSSNVQPAIINNTMVYPAARGGHVREMAYNWQAGGYMTGDLSLRASHLFDGYEIVDISHTKAPQPVVWFVSTSGKLLGLTYVPEEQIGAWHQHDTKNGAFESCASVAEGAEDVLYVVVRRFINGSYVRFIERMETRDFTDPADAFFVDCGMTYDGAPADVITGLDHLEGETVNILADGAVHPPRVVSGGSITLDIEASKIHIGLPIEADMQLLPVALMMRDGSYAQGHTKNVNRLFLNVYRSSGVFAGPSFDRLVRAKQRTDEPYGSPPDLRTGQFDIPLPNYWGEAGQACIRQSDPLPLTILSVTGEYAIGG